MDLKKFFSELKRRNVYKVAITYAIVAWLILQIGSVVFETIKTPEWVMQVLLFFVVIGFPIALILAWAFEMSPQGMIRTKSTAAKENHYSTGKKKPLSHNVYIGILLLIIVGQFIYNKYWNQISINTVNMEKTIAVLPFHNDSSNEENLYFCNGMVEEILNSLQKISELEVKSRTSVEKYRNPTRNLKIIAKELDVNYILEGSVRKSGEDLRIIAQLINAQTGNQLWSETYDGKYTQRIFEFEADIAKKIAASLDAIITPTEEKGINKIPTKNLEAHNLYLNGRFFWHKRTEEDLKRSVHYFEQALALDSTYAKAYAGLADSYFIMANWGWYPENEGYMKGKELATKAISFDSSISEAHATLGGIAIWCEWNWEKAEKELIRAISLNPSYATAHQYYAELLDILQRKNEAREQIDLAIKLNPSAQIMLGVSTMIYYNNNEFKKTIEEKKRRMRFMNEKSSIVIFKSYVHLGMDIKAIDHLKLIVSDSPNNNHRLIEKIYQESGINGVIYWYIDQLKSKEEKWGAFNLYALVGDGQKVIAHLEKYPKSILRIRINPDFKLLRSDPIFMEQFKKLEKTEQDIKNNKFKTD